MQQLRALAVRRVTLPREEEMLHVEDRQQAVFHFQASHHRLPGRIARIGDTRICAAHENGQRTWAGL